MWFAIWTVLILGALAFLAYLGWRLWRGSIQPLLVEFGRAAEVTGRLAVQVAQLQQAHPDPVFTSDVFADAAQREGFARLRHEVRQIRRDRKAERRARTYTRWRELGQPF
ncbi:hypothetical protein [Pseudactinotalea sp. Z1748]|uniref:hypothetical protein n=1 Tax=Pseudactinotalea sp. Z1748 TaxID=3413027 RepID=UPI003C7B5944